MSHDRPRLFHATLVALLIFVAGSSLRAQAPEALFADSPDTPGLQAPANADTRPFFVRSRTTLLRVGVLDRALASPATSSFTLNLFDDVQLALTMERLEIDRFGHRSWVGRITDKPQSGVTLTFDGDAITGLITDGTAVYEIQGLGAGAHKIDQLDTTRMGRDTDVALARDGGAASDAPIAPALGSPAAVSVADIFVYYSASLRAAVGVSTVQSRIAQYIADTNAAYARSGVNGQLQLVGMAELPINAPLDAEDQLNALTDDPGVNNQRNASGADLVTLLVTSFQGDSPTSFTCGIGWVGSGTNADAGFAVVASRSECVYTFAHETGHNLGAQHAPVDGGFATGSNYPLYARGYKVAGVFRTVMAYQCGNPDSCPRIRNFSSTSVLEPPGTGQPTGNSNQRNADRLNELFPAVASYRASSVSFPGAPQNLQAFPNGLNLTLQWQAPASGGAPANYRIVAGTTSGGSNIGQADVGLTTSVSAPLPAGPYFIRVYAMNGAGQGPPSNEVSFTLGTAAPGPPTNLTFNVDAGGTLTLAWQPPASGGPPTDYLLDAGFSSGASNIASGIPVAGTGLVVPGVPFGDYFIRVRARNSGGVSPPSNEVHVSLACTVPSAPQNFSVTHNGPVVTVSWLPPAVGQPSTYLLQAGTSSGAANVFNGQVGLATTLSAQAPPGSFTFFLRVFAISACGTGPASPEASVTVP